MKRLLVLGSIVACASCASSTIGMHPDRIGVAALVADAAHRDGTRVDVVGRFEFSPDTSALYADSGGASVALELPRSEAEMVDLQRKDGHRLRVIGTFGARWCSHACLGRGRVGNIELVEEARE